MGQVLHGCATTTEAVRRAIQRGQESLRTLAKRHGINPKTVAKWKKRTSVSDLPTGPKDAGSRVLTVEEEAVIIAFRRHTLLPLDDCLYALQPARRGNTSRRLGVSPSYRGTETRQTPETGCETSNFWRREDSGLWRIANHPDNIGHGKCRTLQAHYGLKPAGDTRADAPLCPREGATLPREGRGAHSL